MTIEKEIREAMKGEKAVLGTKSVIRCIRTGKVSEVIHASNVPRSTMDDLNHYTGTSGLLLKGFKGNSHQLGETCGKPFSVLLVGIMK